MNRIAIPTVGFPAIYISSRLDADGKPLEHPLMHGIFPDTAKGRADAQDELQDVHEQHDIARRLRGPGYRPGPVEIVRVFNNGEQPLMRVPHPTDFFPGGLPEAQAESQAFTIWYRDQRGPNPTPSRFSGTTSYAYCGIAYSERQAITEDEHLAVIQTDRAMREAAQRPKPAPQDPADVAVPQRAHHAPSALSRSGDALER